MSESGNISLNSSEIPSLEFNEWCLTAVFKHHRASARSVGVAPIVTRRSDVVAGAVALACTVALAFGGGGGAAAQTVGRVVE